MIEISTYYKDNDTATICSSATDYFIQYRKDGEVIFTENFSNQSIYYVEDSAENWSAGIKPNPWDK
jgi:hypothetical protein